MGQTAKTRPVAAGICTDCEARCLGFCGLLGSAEAAGLSTRIQKAKFGPGEEIARQGESANRIGIVSAGLVMVVLLTEEGERHVVQILKPGQIIGTLSASENMFSWEAATPVTICWINRQSLNAPMRDSDEGYSAGLAVIARQLEDQRLWTGIMRGRSTLERIAFWLVQQLADGHDGTAQTIRIKLTRRDLASFLDMTVETLCRCLHQLADQGAIRLRAPDELDIPNPARLRKIARCTDKPFHEEPGPGDASARQDNPFRMSPSTRHGRPLRPRSNPAAKGMAEAGKRSV